MVDDIRNAVRASRDTLLADSLGALSLLATLVVALHMPQIL